MEMKRERYREIREILYRGNRGRDTERTRKDRERNRDSEMRDICHREEERGREREKKRETERERD